MALFVAGLTAKVTIIIIQLITKLAFPLRAKLNRMFIFWLSVTVFYVRAIDIFKFLQILKCNLAGFV